MSTEEQAAILGNLVLERRSIQSQNTALAEGMMRLGKLAAALSPLSGCAVNRQVLTDALTTIHAFQDAGGVDRLRGHVESLLANLDRLQQIEESLR